MPKIKPLEKEIKDKLNIDGKYCLEGCAYKHFEYCVLFDIKTGYDFKVEKAKRCNKCLYYFKEGK